MGSAQLRTMPLQRLASSALLAMILFQLGACPCGCLEHNAWFQMLGLSEHHDDVATASDGVSVRDAGHHDCTGEHAPDYLDNSKLLGGDHRLASGLPATSFQSNVLELEATLSSRLLRDLQLHRMECAPARSLLQVYQL